MRSLLTVLIRRRRTRTGLTPIGPRALDPFADGSMHRGNYSGISYESRGIVTEYSARARSIQEWGL